MRVSLTDRGIRVVLLDIEGTTTPMSFVHDVLFPFARQHLAAWSHEAAGSDEFRDVLMRLAAEHAGDRSRGETVPPWNTATADETRASLEAYALWLMDRDRKSTGLKLLQGILWDRGYAAGDLHGQVFADVPAAIIRWRESGVGAAIYSSGSALAQQRLFASTPYGDLTPLIVGFFDTSVGAKMESESYQRIAAALNQRPKQILFVSDITGELAAATTAGCRVALSLRPGNRPQQDAETYDAIRTFGEIG